MLDEVWAALHAENLGYTADSFPEELRPLKTKADKEKAQETYSELRDAYAADMTEVGADGSYLAYLVVAWCDREHGTNGLKCSDMCHQARRMV